MTTDADHDAPSAIAREVLAKITRRRQRKLSAACMLLGVGIAEIGLVAWGVRSPDPGIIILGIPFALVMGLVFGIIATISVPLALGTKRGRSAITTVFAATSSLLVLFTMVTGIFPFFPAGILLTVVTLAVHVTRPDVIPAWSPATCVGCGYDVSGTAEGICPECGLTESSLRELAEANAKRKHGASDPVVAWLFLVLAAWVSAAIAVHAFFGPP